MPIEVYCSCSSKDQKYLDELAVHFAILETHQLIRVRKNSVVIPGANWREEERQLINSAQVIIFLISAALLASSFHEQEIAQAINLHKQKKTLVIPILLQPISPASLEHTSLAKFQPLPRNRKPIVKWPHRDEAFAQITEELVSLINSQFPAGTSAPAYPQVPLSTLPSDTPQLPVNPRLPNYFEPVPLGKPAEVAISNDVELTVDLKLAQFSVRERRHRKAWQRLRILSESAAIVTGLLALSDFFTEAYPTFPPAWGLILRLLVVFAAIGTLLCIPSLAQAHSARRWQYYQRYKTDLSNEKKQYQNNQGIYALNVDKQRVFRERVSQIITNVGVGTNSTDETRDYLQS